MTRGHHACAGAHPLNITQSTSPVREDLQRVRNEMAALVRRGQIELPMLPEHAARVVALAGSKDADAASLAGLIMSDQALAAQVMKVARSAAYKPASPISSLQHAVAWLGLGEVADIAFTAAIRGRLLAVPGQRDRAQHMWKVSVAAAIWSREIAALSRRYSEVTYLCGLLHDIGKPVALLASADVAACVGARLTDDDYEALIHEFHAPLGVLLAERWKLPEAVATCIRCWPDYQTAEEFADEVPVVHLAHHVAELMLSQGAEYTREALRDNPVLDLLVIGPDRFKGLLDRAEWVLGQVEAY